MTESFDVGVVGAGYVGLVTAACLTHVGPRVTYLDRDEGRVQGLGEEGRVFDPYEALKGAHATVVVTEWEEIRSLDLKRAASLIASPRS